MSWQLWELDGLDTSYPLFKIRPVQSSNLMCSLPYQKGLIWTRNYG